MQQLQSDASANMAIAAVAAKCVASVRSSSSLHAALFPSSTDSQTSPPLTSQTQAVMVLEAVLRGLQEPTAGGSIAVRFCKGSEGDWARIFDSLDELPLHHDGGGEGGVGRPLPTFSDTLFKMKFVRLGSPTERSGINDLIAAVSRPKFGVASRWLWRGAITVVTRKEDAMSVVAIDTLRGATDAVQSGAITTDAPTSLSRLLREAPACRSDVREEVCEFCKVACVESVPFFIARLSNAEGTDMLGASFAEFLSAVGNAAGPSAAAAAAVVDRAAVDAMVVAMTTRPRHDDGSRPAYVPLLCMNAASKNSRAIHALYMYRMLLATPPKTADNDPRRSGAPRRLDRLLSTAVLAGDATDSAEGGLAAFALLLRELVKISANFLEQRQSNGTDAVRTFIDAICLRFDFRLSDRVESFWGREGPSGSLRAFSALLADRTLFDHPTYAATAAAGGTPAPRETVVGDHFAAHFSSTRELWEEVLSTDSADACLALRIRPPLGLSAAAASSWCPFLVRWRGGGLTGCDATVLLAFHEGWLLPQRCLPRHPH